MKKFLLLPLLALGISAGALEFTFPAENIRKNWNASDGSAVTLRNGALFNTGAVQLSKKFGVPRGESVMRVTIRTEKPCAYSPLTLIVIFSGGKTAGNGFWNFAIRQGTTPAVNGFPACNLTVPPDATDYELKLVLGENGARCGIVSVTVESLTPQKLADSTVTLKVDPGKTVSEPTAFHFGVNMVGTFDGVWNGTRPDPEKRRVFAEFLKKSGVLAARYPGGTESHWFLPESRELAQKCYKLATRRDAPHLVPFTEFADAMHEAGVKVIYQLNTSFFVDENGEIRPIDATHFPKQAGFADAAPRYAEAGAALERAFEKGILSGARVDYWEIGNEEFAYMTTAQYADICAAYLPVIARHDPGKPICVTNMKDLPSELEKRGVWQYVTGVTTHYPYAGWPRPFPAYRTADTDAFARANVNFPKNLNGIPDKGRKISVSETSVFNLFTYDPFIVQPSFAQALTLAANWEKLLVNPRVDMAVYHDFESVYFGLTRYDVSFYSVDRKFTWLKGQNPPPPLPPGRDSNWYVNPSKRNATVYFDKKYVPSPGSLCFAMLSEFAGGALYATAATAPGGVPGGCYAGRAADGKRMVIFSNNFSFPVALKLTFPGFPQQCAFRMLSADDNAAALPGEYRDFTGNLTLNAAGLTVPPRTILQLKEL